MKLMKSGSSFSNYIHFYVQKVNEIAVRYYAVFLKFYYTFFGFFYVKSTKQIGGNTKKKLALLGFDTLCNIYGKRKK